MFWSRCQHFFVATNDSRIDDVLLMTYFLLLFIFGFFLLPQDTQMSVHEQYIYIFIDFVALKNTYF